MTLITAAATFVLTHLSPSLGVRRLIVPRIGESIYLGVFVLVSLVSLNWLTNEFNGAAYGTKLWTMPEAWNWVKAVLILLAAYLVIAGVSTPNPSFPGAGQLLERANAADGVFAITRHPLMWGIGIWALTHIVTQATPRGLIFFGAFAVVSLGGAWLQENRKRKALGAAWDDFQRKTSFLPFAALAAGRSSLSLKAIGWWRLALAVVLWAALLHFHARLFGAVPLSL